MMHSCQFIGLYFITRGVTTIVYPVHNAFLETIANLLLIWVHPSRRAQSVLSLMRLARKVRPGPAASSVYKKCAGRTIRVPWQIASVFSQKTLVFSTGKLRMRPEFCLFFVYPNNAAPVTWSWTAPVNSERAFPTTAVPWLLHIFN